MKFLIFLMFCNSLLVPPGMCDGESFCYEEESCGPKHWKGVCSTGSHQSPIDIPATSERLDYAEAAELRFSRDYWQDQDFTLKNNGHTIQASSRPDLTSTSFLLGTNLNGKKYVFSQLHFHWGSRSHQGCEHSINNNTYPMEGHFVHYSSQFDSLTAAIESKQAEALAVVGVVYMLSFDDNPAFTPLLKTMTHLRKSGDSAKGKGLNLVKLLPSYAKVYNFQYEGSLTTPSCAEVVLWNVLSPEAFISEKQLNEFRRQLDDHNRPLQNNFRPIQPLNNREIRIYNTQLTQ